MTNQTKWALAGFAGLIVATGLIENKHAGVIVAAMFGFMCWLIWRAFKVVYALTQPVRDKIKPQVDAINQHVYSGLRSAGLGGVADVASKVDAGIHSALKAKPKSDK